MSEIDNLLQELRNMKSEAKAGPINSKETWSKVGKQDFGALGFATIEELKAWVESNPYSNI